MKDVENRRSHIVTLSRRSKRLAARNVSRQVLTEDALQPFRIQTSPNVTNSEKRKRPSRRALSPFPHTQRKTQSKDSNPSRKRSCEALDGDSDSVEVVRVSLPSSNKKPRPFQNSSIIPDWVPSNGLQSVSQQFMEDEPWNATPDTYPSSKNLVPKSMLLPGRSKTGKLMAK
jgi:hypothetical protein